MELPYLFLQDAKLDLDQVLLGHRDDVRQTLYIEQISVGLIYEKLRNT